jgi:hypothetical protein
MRADGGVEVSATMAILWHRWSWLRIPRKNRYKIFDRYKGHGLEPLSTARAGR